MGRCMDRDRVKKVSKKKRASESTTEEVSKDKRNIGEYVTGFVFLIYYFSFVRDVAMIIK